MIGPMKSFALLVLFIGVVQARVPFRNRNRHRNQPSTTTSPQMDEMSEGANSNLTAYANSNATLEEAVADNSSVHSSKMNIIQEAKLHIIRIHILESLGLTQAPNITVPTYDNLSLSESKFCYRPICSIPSRTTDEDMWTNTTSNILNLYFNVTSRRHHRRVKTATLWLHLKEYEHSCSCDNRIIIKVGYLAKPLKRHQKKAKRRVTDLRLVTHQSNSWQSFIIERAVTEWMNPKKNFGLQIIIKDQNENFLNAHEIISHIDCSDPNVQMKECVYNSMPAPINPVNNFPLLFIEHEAS